MKKLELLFAHDHIFYEFEGQIKSPGRLPSEAWERYLDRGSSLTVVARQGVSSSLKSNAYVSSEHGQVAFNLFSSDKQLFINLLNPCSSHRTVVKELVSKANAVICRLPSRIGHAVLVEAKRQNKPIAVEVVGCVYGSYSSYGTWFASLVARYARYEMRRDVARADYAIYVTKKYLQRVYPCTGEVATASNVELVKRSSPNLKDERALKTFKIGFVGDVGVKGKGFDWMLQAIHQFAEQLDVRVLVAIAGTPVQRFNGDIYEDLEERVLLDNLGLLDPKTALIDFYRSLDVLVSASFSEGLPRIVIEAMSQGVPCIATSVGGTAELFHGVESLLIEPLDNSGLIRALEKVLLDNNFHRRCSLQVFENTAHYEKSRLSEVRQAFWSSFEDYVRSRC